MADNYDILCGSGIKKFADDGRVWTGEMVTATEWPPMPIQEQTCETASDIAEAQQGIRGGIMNSPGTTVAGGPVAAQPLSGVTLHHAQFGGWIVTRPSYGAPMGAFSTLEEAFEFIRDNVV